MKRSRLMVPAVICAAVLGGCAAQQNQNQLAKALSARTDLAADYNQSARFIYDSYVAKHDKDYVVWSMEYASLCLMGGNYDAAHEELMKCYADIQGRQDKDKETAAALSNEANKIFKGEPFERAMVCTYLGILNYIRGDYNNARIFATRADLEDATTEENMKDFRDDFGVAHYWLGRAYLKLEQNDNARVAFKKASTHVPRKNEQQELAQMQKVQASARQKRIRLEQECYKRACSEKQPVPGAADASVCPAEAEVPDCLSKDAAGSSPVLACAANAEEFFDVDYQRDVNLILMIETGIGPIKYLVGDDGYMDAIMRAPYQEKKVVVYLDGLKAGSAMPLLDMFHQADTRGMSEKDNAQAAKGLTKSILRQMPYGIGSLAGMWDVRADDRHWRLIPGEVHVLAAKVKPGTYTISLQCLDSNGYLLPRYRLTRYHIPVREGQENIYFLHTLPEADNQYVPTQK